MVCTTAVRPKHLEELLPAAQRAGVGILARVPLASGLLSGKYDESTTFPPDDHRNFNRDGEAWPTAAFALRWVIDQPGVPSVIPGARNVTQVRGNAAAASMAPLSDSQLSDLERVYDERIRAHVHDRWQPSAQPP